MKPTPTQRPVTPARRRHLSFILAALGPFSILTLTAPLPAADINPVWSGATGDWLDAAQWSPVGIPNNSTAQTYAPTINTGAVSLAGAISVTGFTLDAPATLTLAPAASLSVRTDDFAITSLSGLITLQPTSTLTLQSGVNPSFNNLTVAGDGILYSSPYSAGGAFSLIGNSTIANLSSSSGFGGTGTLTVTSSYQYFGGTNYSPGGVIIAPTATFIGIGSATIYKLTNNGAATFFNNLGFATFNNTSTTSIGGGPSNARPDITVGDGLNTGTISLLRGSFSQSTSLPYLNSGTISATAGTLSLGNATSSGLITLAAGVIATYNKLSLTDGAVISGFATLTHPSSSNPIFVQGSVTLGNIDFAGIAGTGAAAAAHITGTAHWQSPGTDRQLANIALTIDPAASLTIGASGSIPSLSASLTNNGLVTAQQFEIAAGGTFTNNAAFSFAQLSLKPGATLFNNGTVTSTAGGTLTAAGSSITNAGIWNHTGGLFLTVLGQFNNTGTVNANNAYLSLAGGGASSGHFAVSSGSLILTAPYTLAAGARISGSNGYVATHSTLTLTDLIPASNFRLGAGADPSTYGILTGPGTLDLSGFSLLSSGTVASLGLLHVLAAGALTVGGNNESSFIRISNTTLLNDGILAFNPSTLSVFTVQNAATLLNRGTTTLARAINTTDLSSLFINEGLVSATAAVPLATPFYNTGSLTFAPPFNGTLTLAGGGTASGYFSVTAGSTILFTNDYLLNNATLAGPGKYAGSVTLSGNVTLPGTAAFSRVSGTGTLNISSAISGSTTFNTGTVVNLLPGASFSNSPSQSITLSGATLVNQTSITLSSFAFNLTNGSTLLNSGYLASSVNTPFTSDNNPANALINTGTLVLTPAASTAVPVPLYNTGTLIGPASSFATPMFSAGGTSSGTILANIAFSGAHTFKNITLNSATATSGNISLVSQISLEGNNTAYLTNIIAGLAGPGTLTASGTSWSGGTLTNAGGIRVSPTITKTFLTNLTATANFAITGTGLNTSTKVLDAATLTIPADSTAYWSSSNSPRADALSFRNGAQILNQGTFSVLLTTSNINTDGNPNNAIYNAGNFIVNHNSGTLTLTVPFHNAGIVTVSSGYADFAAGYVDETTPGTTGDFAFNGANTGLALSNHVYNFGPAIDLGTGNLRGAGTLTSALTIGGTLAVSATSSAVGNLTLLAPVTGTGSLSIPGQRTLVAPSIQLNSATISGTLTLTPAGGASRFSTLTLSRDTANTFTSRIELADNPLIVQTTDASKPATLSLLQSALAQGAAGTVGITSSTTAADPAHKTTVAVDNALLNLTTFNGAPVNYYSLLVESTWLGDSNLDRRVDVSDLGTLATYYGQSVPWGILQGDFNQDGVVNVTDLGLLATNYGQGTAPGAVFSLESDLSSFSALPSSFPTPIPEPTTLALLLPPLLLRRARRQQRPHHPTPS